MVIGFLFAVVTNFASYWFSDKIVLRMYNAQEVGPGHRLFDIVDRLATARRPAAAALLRHPATRRRTRSRPAATRSTRRWRRRKASCGCSTDDELEGVLGARAGARQASRHPDQLGRGDAGRGDHDDLALRDVLRRRARRRRSRGLQSVRAARDDHPRADRGDADSGGDLAVARVRRGRRRRGDRRRPARAGQRAAQDRGRRRKQIPLDANPATAHMFIIKPFSASGLLGLFSTHPPTEDRIQALATAELRRERQLAQTVAVKPRLSTGVPFAASVCRRRTRCT